MDPMKLLAEFLSRLQDAAYEEGYDDGKDVGYDEGYHDGCEVARQEVMEDYYGNSSD